MKFEGLEYSALVITPEIRSAIDMFKIINPAFKDSDDWVIIMFALGYTSGGMAKELQDLKR